jgi:hypothetical protein
MLQAFNSLSVLAKCIVGNQHPCRVEQLGSSAEMNKQVTQ